MRSIISRGPVLAATATLFVLAGATMAIAQAAAPTVVASGGPDPVAVLTALGLGRYAAGIVSLGMCIAYVITWLVPLMPAPATSAGPMYCFLYGVANKIAGNVGHAANANAPAPRTSPLAPPRTLAVLLAVGLGLPLAGCAEFNAAISAANTYTAAQITAQQKNIQGVNDNLAKVWADSACELPYGEVARNGSGNPNMSRAIVELCGSPAGTTVISTTPSASAVTTVPTVTVIAPPAPPAK